MPCKYTHRVPLCNTARFEVRASHATTPPPYGHAHHPQIEANPPSSKDNTANTNPEAATTSIPIVAAIPQTLATNSPPPTVVPTSSLAPFQGAMQTLRTLITHSLNLAQGLSGLDSNTLETLRILGIGRIRISKELLMFDCCLLLTCIIRSSQALVRMDEANLPRWYKNKNKVKLAMYIAWHAVFFCLMLSCVPRP